MYGPTTWTRGQDPHHRPELSRHHDPGPSAGLITPANIAGAGPVGLVSTSGTLTYQMMYELRDFGFSISVGLAGTR